MPADNVTVAVDYAPTIGNVYGHDYVQLWYGGPRWATMNVGADLPEKDGGLYAWGATETQSYYNWVTAPFNGGDTLFNEKVWNYGKEATGNTYYLLFSYDVARQKWGGTWRIPTDEELCALIENCEWEWTNSYNETGKPGMIVKGKEAYADHSIFLPAAGCFYDSKHESDDRIGVYWSNTVFQLNSGFVYILHFSPSQLFIAEEGYRCDGYSVRPIID